MPTIYLVRHGRAAAGFGEHADPGLDSLGREQAAQTAGMLAETIETPLPIYSSPLLRARQTAMPLAALWDREIAIEPRVAEIPSPTADLGERARWLAGAMAGPWSALPPKALDWRQDVIERVASFGGDAVVFCHFIVINVVVGAATASDALIVFRPGNGSVTRIASEGGKLAVLELGGEAETRVN